MATSLPLWAMDAGHTRSILRQAAHCDPGKLPKTHCQIDLKRLILCEHTSYRGILWRLILRPRVPF